MEQEKAEENRQEKNDNRIRLETLLLVFRQDKGVERFERHILAIGKLERYVNYLEVKYQFKFNILEEPDMWYNDNINGCWYPHLYDDIGNQVSEDQTILETVLTQNNCKEDQQSQQ